MESRRAVSTLGVSAMMGASGRSRAARNAVEPDLVQQTMARAWMVCVTSCTAAMMRVGRGFFRRGSAGRR